MFEPAKTNRKKQMQVLREMSDLKILVEIINLKNFTRQLPNN